MIEEWQDEEQMDSYFKWKNELLLYKGRILLCRIYKVNSRVLEESHRVPSTRHMFLLQTYNNVW